MFDKIALVEGLFAIFALVKAILVPNARVKQLGYLSYFFLQVGGKLVEVHVVVVAAEAELALLGRFAVEALVSLVPRPCSIVFLL